MKLEPNQVILYLPYSLKVIMEGKKCNVAWMSTKNIAIIRPDGIGELKKINWEHAHLNIKPILRPLSDLNKEVEHNGLKFNPFLELTKLEFGELEDNHNGHFKISNEITESDYEIECEYLLSWFTFYYNKKTKKFYRYDDGIGIGACSSELILRLFEWHYDVFGLIPQGLAIDINTIN